MEALWLPGTTLIFTDGASRGNGSTTSKAASAVWTELGDQLVQVLPDGSTNQLAELTAINMAIHLALEKYKSEPVTIVTDSKYSIDCLTKWNTSWEKNGFMTSKKQPVKHANVIQSMLRDMKEHGQVTFMHVNSHKPAPKMPAESKEYRIWYGNHMVDALAESAVNSAS